MESSQFITIFYFVIKPSMPVKEQHSEFIRKATPADYKTVAFLMLQAMQDMGCIFTNTTDYRNAIPLFELFFKSDGNQYSYENTLVYEKDGLIAGTITAYDGSLLHTYRAPFFKHLEMTYGLIDFYAEEETQAGEFYIDTLSVAQHAQGQGIGSSLLQAAITLAKKLGHQKVGLLVNSHNPQAKKLYRRIGFQTIDQKYFLGGEYAHMQIEVL